MELTDELAEARKQSIEEIARYIFPIEVQELDEQDMDISKSGNHILVCYCIAQNFGRVNFWKLVARHTNGREKFGKSSTTGLSCIVYMVTFKNLVGKILAGLPKFCTIRYFMCVVLPVGSSIDFSTELLVEDGWVLSCQKPSVQPKITIVCSALPANGDYSDYVTAGEPAVCMI